MLEPAALAETVTPPSFSPAAEVTVPLSSASAADAAEHMPGAIALDAIALDANMMASRLEPVRLRAFPMASLLILIVVARRALRGGRGGRGGGYRHDRQI